MKSLNEDGLPILQSPRLVLTIPSNDDIPEIISFFDRNSAFFKSTSPIREIDFNTPAYWVTVLSDNRSSFLNGSTIKLFMFLRADEELRVIGEVNFSQIFRGVFLACKLGYKIDKNFQGRGLMKEGLTRAIEFCFNEVGLHRIEANYMPNNLRSANVLKSLGFDIEGKANNYLKIDGVWEDHILTSLTNHQL